MTTRASQLPRRNNQLHSMEKELHATNQGELVQARSLQRSLGRTGIKVQELGSTGPASKIAMMSHDELASFLSSALKTHRNIQRIELYKSSKLGDEDVLDSQAFASMLPVSKTVVNSIERTADKLALEFVKGSSAGLDLDAEGNLYVWTYLDKKAAVSAGPKKKKKDKDDEEEKEDLPLIRIHYLLR